MMPVPQRFPEPKPTGPFTPKAPVPGEHVIYTDENGRDHAALVAESEYGGKWLHLVIIEPMAGMKSVSEGGKAGEIRWLNKVPQASRETTTRCWRRVGQNPWDRA